MFSKPLSQSTKPKTNTSLFEMGNQVSPCFDLKYNFLERDGFSRARVEYCNIHTDVNETGFSFI